MNYPIMSGARFSDCKKYRYALWRSWSFTVKPAVFVMLNPSTADETVNDPTVERCLRRARQMGFGGLIVTNIFALRSTDPQQLYAPVDPIGPENDREIKQALALAGVVVCAWGNHGEYLDRGASVRRLIKSVGITPHHLGLTQHGQPRHPLYVSYLRKPEPWSFE